MKLETAILDIGQYGIEIKKDDIGRIVASLTDGKGRQFASSCIDTLQLIDFLADTVRMLPKVV
jgi:hypothetical protein